MASGGTSILSVLLVVVLAVALAFGVHMLLSHNGHDGNNNNNNNNNNNDHHSPAKSPGDSTAPGEHPITGPVKYGDVVYLRSTAGCPTDFGYVTVTNGKFQGLAALPAGPPASSPIPGNYWTLVDPTNHASKEVISYGDQVLLSTPNPSLAAGEADTNVYLANDCGNEHEYSVAAPASFCLNEPKCKGCGSNDNCWVPISASKFTHTDQLTLTWIIVAEDGSSGTPLTYGAKFYLLNKGCWGPNSLSSKDRYLYNECDYSVTDPAGNWAPLVLSCDDLMRRGLPRHTDQFKTWTFVGVQ